MKTNTNDAGQLSIVNAERRQQVIYALRGVQASRRTKRAARSSTCARTWTLPTRWPGAARKTQKRWRAC